MPQGNATTETAPVPLKQSPPTRRLPIHPPDSSVTRSTTKAADPEDPQRCEFPTLAPKLRSVSLSSLPRATREREEDPRYRITYRDDALCQLSLDNARRLLRAANAMDDHDTSNNSVRLAKKALRYRRVLERAQSVNVDDPSFDLNAFLRLTWCKADSPSTKGKGESDD